MEDISAGERVRKFKIEGKIEEKQFTIFEGSSIGHKFICQFDDLEVFAERLNISDSKGTPIISNFSV